MNLCTCGCGNEIALEKKFIVGHNARGTKWTEERLQKRRNTIKYNAPRFKMSIRCMCGCNQYTSPGRRFIHGHHNRGIPKTEETKRKISISETGKKGLCKENNPNWHKPCPLERKKMLSEKLRGENAPNWQGGISRERYCSRFNRLLKEEIRNKFGRKCFLCNKPESENHDGLKLPVHHVNYDKEQGCNGKKWELVPLCKTCHSKTNHHREQYRKILLDKLQSIGITCST